MKINNAILTGSVSAVGAGLVLKKDTYTGPMELPVVPGANLSGDQRALLLATGQLRLSGRLAMIKQTHHQYPKGALEAVCQAAQDGDLARAETLRKRLVLGLGESFTATLVVDSVEPMGVEIENQVELVAEIFEFGADQPRFGYKPKNSPNDYRNARKYNIKQAVQPKRGDTPSQVMRFRGYCNRDKVSQALSTSKGRYHVEGRLLGINYLVRDQPESVHALLRKESMNAADYAALAKALLTKPSRIDGVALDLTKATRLQGEETFFFDLSEVNLPISVKTERGFEVVNL